MFKLLKPPLASTPVSMPSNPYRLSNYVRGNVEAFKATTGKHPCEHAFPTLLPIELHCRCGSQGG
eukprot:364904-Chlamydomonas_euryale.AAC.1